jgi:hypothetical protein
MATDPENTSGQTTKRLSPTTRIFALLWSGSTAFIFASLAMLYWQGEPTSLGYWLISLLSFIVVPSWLLLSLCGFGLWVSRAIGQHRPSAGRISRVTAGCLAVAVAMLGVLIVIVVVCSQTAAQNACQQLFLAYVYVAFWMAAAGMPSISVWLLGFAGAVLVLGACWVAKRPARPNGLP